MVRKLSAPPKNRGQYSRRQERRRQQEREAAAATEAAAVAAPTGAGQPAEPPAPAPAPAPARDTVDEPQPQPEPSTTPSVPPVHRTRSTTTAERVDEGAPVVRDVAPPPQPAIELEELVKLLRGISRSSLIARPQLEIDAEEQNAHIQKTLKWIGTAAPTGLIRNIEHRVCAESFIPRFCLSSGYYHTKEGKKNCNGRIESGDEKHGGVYILNYARLRDLMLPTRTIGRKKTGGDKKIPAKGTPLMPVGWGKAPNPSYDYGPYYNCGKKSRLIRVGDYLGVQDFVRAFTLCRGNHWNYLAILLINCHAKWHRLAKADEGEPEFDQEEELETVNRVGLALEEIMHHPGQPSRTMRNTCNPYIPKYDKHFLGPMRQWREDERARYLKERKIDESEVNLRLDKVALLSYVIIMIHSASVKDEKGEQIFYKLINGRHDSLSFLWPLKEIPLQDLFDYYRELYHSNGMHGLNAHALLTFLIPLFVLDNDKVSLNLRILNTYPEIDNRKSRIALDEFGMYKGVDVDKSERKKLAEALAAKISKGAGLNLNDDIGELCQQYNNSGEERERAIKQFNELAKRSKAFERVYPRWIDVLKKVNNEFYLD